MLNQYEDDDQKTMANAAKAKQKDKDKENDENDDDEEDGDEERYLEMLEFQAAESLKAVHDSNPQWVNPQFLDLERPESDGGMRKRAWGKREAEVDESVPVVPVRFEGVTTLGPLIIICPPKGIHMPHLGNLRASTLVVFQDGFAYQAASRDVKLWSFEEVSAIQTNVVGHRDTFPEKKVYEYTLFRNSGESLILDEGVQHVPAAAHQIKLAVFKRLVESFVQRCEAGETLIFGPVTVQKQNGLQLGSHHYAWGDIKNISVMDGEFEVMLSNNKHSSIRTSEIPNLELLGRVIGVEPGYVDDNILVYLSFWDRSAV